MEPIRRDNWARGANNIDPPNRLPDGFVRRLTNVDASAAGILGLRAGYKQVYSGTDVRGAWGVGKYLVFADGLQLSALDTSTDTVRSLGVLQSRAPLAGAVLNGQLYLCSLTDSLRTDGVVLHGWHVRAPGFSIEATDGALPAGVYKVALVATGADGEESGCDPKILNLPNGGGIRIATNDGRPLRLYASVANGATLFYQGLMVTTTKTLSSVDDHRERLTTDGLVGLPACSELHAYHGVLVGRDRSYVFFTSPMMPHLMDPISGFLQYGAAVDLVAPTDGGVYIAADKTYFVPGLETAQVSQREVLDFGAVAGTVTKLPDGRVAWFTAYGLAIGSPDGQVTLPNRDSYAPDVAAVGAGGLIKHAGNHMVVATMRGVTSYNNLSTGDYADLETGNE